jgi:acyl-CoA thioesterase FadM
VRTYRLDIATADLGGAHSGVDDIEALPPHARHVASWDVVRLASATVRSYLLDVAGEALRVSGVARVEVDYLGELVDGPTDVDVTIARIGSSSFQVHAVLRQLGMRTSSVTFVQVKKDYATQTSVPLTPEERAVLEQELEPATAASA